MPSGPICLEADFSFLQDRFTGVCRRKSKRFHFDLAAVGFLTFPDDGTSQEVWLLDISELGIGFCSEWPLEIGAELKLRITSGVHSHKVLRAKVMHSTRQARGDWRIGCQFQELVTPEMIDDLL